MLQNDDAHDEADRIKIEGYDLSAEQASAVILIVASALKAWRNGEVPTSPSAECEMMVHGHGYHGALDPAVADDT